MIKELKEQLEKEYGYDIITKLTLLNNWESFFDAYVSLNDEELDTLYNLFSESDCGDEYDFVYQIDNYRIYNEIDTETINKNIIDFMRKATEDMRSTCYNDEF